MTLENEDDVKRALEIKSWRNLSRDKVMRFAAMMPDMDRELSLAIVAQFPAFSQFALDVLGSLEKESDATRESNASSQEQVHAGYREVREVLKGELDRGELSPEDRRFVLESLIKLVEQESEKDTENKRFLSDLFSKRVLAAGAVVAAGLVFVGGKLLLEREGGGGSEIET